jgi:hypothetical protein
MKKIICFIILMTAALNIEASDFFGSGDPGGSCAGTKMAITFNYDHLTIDGNSTHQYLVDVYASNKDEKEFKAQFPSYDEYISYWNLPYQRCKISSSTISFQKRPIFKRRMPSQFMEIIKGL